MKTCHVQASGVIELLFYDELDEADRLHVEQHLATCAECRRTVEDLATIRTALADRPTVEGPPGGDWSGFMSRLDMAIRSTGSPPRFSDVLQRAPAQSSRRIRPLLAMAALLTLVTLSILSVVNWREEEGAAGRTTTGRPAVSARAAAPGQSVPVARFPSRDAAFAALSEQHLERSKLVVLKLANEDEAARDLSYERRLASTLLSDTRLYRLTAEERGMTSLARVMGDLELVLLQTSMSDERDADSVEQIQRLIHKRDLVSRMNAVVLAGGM